MLTENYAQFSTDAVNQCIQTAQAHSQPHFSKAIDHTTAFSDGSLRLRAECISVTVHNSQVCLNLPFQIGEVCLPIPAWVPNGTVAQACLDVCTKWGIPCGAEVRVSVAGQIVVEKSFGCSC